MTNIYAYVRVSTKDQKEDRQLIAMEEVGVPKNKIYVDKQSGKDFERPQYKKMIKKLREGDILYIKSIDRLGRDYDEILEQWRIITKDKKVDIVVLDMPLLDTREKQENLTGKFIADLVLQILSYVAQTEREFIKKRQAEGIAAAKSRGVKFGVRPKALPSNFYDIKTKCEKREISLRKGAKILNMPYSTFYKYYQLNNELNNELS